MRLSKDFISLIKRQTGAETDAFIEALNEPQSTSVRINSKLPPSEIDIIKGATPISYCSTGYSLKERPDFTMDPMLHGGAYYVQEASSMYLEQIVKKYLSGSVKCLDLCAAPGGKSTHLASLLSKESLLISNEVMPQRANILNENMTKWGDANTIVTNNTPSDFQKLKGFFDIIVTDVPCSGEGMFRKEPKAVEDWSLDAVMMCAERQKNILTDIWDSLKEGGLLIYSTCTFNHYEDEENVEWIAETLGAELLEQRHFYFHQTIGEGFFIAALRKTAPMREASIPRQGRQKKVAVKRPAFFRTIRDSDRYSTLELSGTVCAIPSSLEDEFNYIAANFRVVKGGIGVCTYKGKDEIPAHALAVSKILDKGSCNVCEIDRPTAIQFLKREAITISGAEKGHLLVCYRGLPLGWVKNLGNRCNNLYPDYWRIRK